MALIQYISRIQFDYGARETLKSELALLGIERPMIVTDKGVVNAKLLDKALSSIQDIPYTCFDDTPSHPTEEALEKCLELYKENNCDGLVAVGGGSPIDLAKAVALLDSHGGKIEDYGILNGGAYKIRTISPVIAMPTTAGTGAEVGRAIVMTLKSGKIIVAVSMNNIPATVICDPELTFTLPPHLTAATGIDALSHGIEAYMSNVINPPAAAMALDVIKRVGLNIKTATSNGTDLNARYNMMMGALMGGMVLQKSLGAIHALSNPLGEYGFHHGMINGVLLPHVIKFNQEAAADKVSDIEKALDLPKGQTLVDWSVELLNDLKMPTTLKELGFDLKHTTYVAKAAAKDHLSASNPRAVSVDDYRKLIQDAY